MTIDDLRPIRASYWVVPGKLLAGEYAGSRDEAQTRQRISALIAAGFDTFIDLTCEDELPPYLPFLEAAGLPIGLVSYQRFPILDGGLPTVEMMTAIINAIDVALAGRRKLYLHCHGGIGRTGTVIGCYLRQHGSKGWEAVKRLKAYYRTSEQFAFFPYIPETDEQLAFILHWTRSLPRTTHLKEGQE